LQIIYCVPLTIGNILFDYDAEGALTEIVVAMIAGELAVQ